MDYEKEYKKLKAGIKKAYLYAQTDSTKAVLESILSELKESEDERIRKEILDYCKNKAEKYPNDPKYKNISAWIAWLEKQKTSEEALQYLKENHSPSEISDFQNAMNIATAKAYDKGMKDGLEKQGEQKPTDKVEPKFKVGDYVVGKYISGYISEVRDDCYLLDYQGFLIDKQDNYHLWTIQDAKDGDVLADGNFPFIFKRIDSMQRTYAYCGINGHGNFSAETESELGEWTWMQDIKPATKEQRDLLFQKMKEAGYEWDADKKDLKKIEPESENFKRQLMDKITELHSTKTDEWIEDYWQHKKVNNPYSYDKGEEIQFDHQGFVRFCKKYCKKPSEWSEEDETKLTTAETFIKNTSLIGNGN